MQRTKKNDAHITSPWDATPLARRCAAPEVTEVIPAAVLQRLLAETSHATAEGHTGGVDVVDLGPEDFIVDDSGFETAFEALRAAELP